MYGQTKIIRIIKQIEWLKERKKTIKELANYFEVDKRTILRDLYEIKWSLGFDLVREGKKTETAFYSINSGRK